MNPKVLSPAEVWTADDDVRYVPTEGATRDFCALAHESRYNWVLRNLEIAGKKVLDFGCGSGFGSFIIGQKAEEVCGLDYSPQSIAFAKQQYGSNKIQYLAADATSRSEVFAQLKHRSFDIILSFDVIEHIPRYVEYLEIIADLIRQNGTLVIGCPNRLQTLNWNKDWNPYHSNEFAPEEFRALLSNYFEDVTLLAQDFHSDEMREQARRRNYGTELPLPPLQYHEHDLEFESEPSAEALSLAFGLVAICKGVKESTARKAVVMPKLRVLLVEPKYSWDEALPWIPIGKAYLASVLREHNFEVSIIDNALKKYSDEELIQAMTNFHPDVIGVGGMTLQFSDTKRIAQLAREAFGSDVLLVGGGVHLTIRPEDGTDDFDFIALGEGEQTLLELCERYAEERKAMRDVSEIAGLAFKSENGELVRTKKREFIRDLNVLPLPAYDLLPVRQYNDFLMTGERAVSVMTSRGCPYNCEFCASPELSKRKVRYFSLEYSFRLIEHLKRNYGFTNFRIMDDAFTLSKKRVLAFCDEISNRSLQYNMTCLTHVEACDYEMFVKMKQAGFSIIALGIESGNDRILKLVNKGTTTEEVIRSISSAKKAGLMVEGLFMIGNIGETKETIEDSIEFAKRYNPPFENGKRTGFNWFQFATPFPGSRFFDEADQYGEVITRNFEQYSHQIPVFIPKGLDEKTLTELRDKALKETTEAPAMQVQPCVFHRVGKEQKRILHVGWGHPPNIAAGPIYYLQQLCLEQKARGFAVECFVAGNLQGDPTKSPSVVSAVHGGITYHIVENRPSHYFDWENPGREVANNEIAKLFRDLVERWRPEVVHFHNLIGLSMSLPEIAKGCGAATLLSAHNYWTVCTRDDLFTPEETICGGPEDGRKCAVCVGYPSLANEYEQRIAKARGLLNKSVDVVLAVSTRVREILVRAGVDEKKVLIQHIGSRAAEINWEAIGRHRVTKFNLSKPVKFAFVGTMSPRKGPHVVLEAVKHLLDKQGEFVVEFYGGGLCGTYEQRISELLSSDSRLAQCVSIKGGYFHAQLASLLKTVDVAIIPPVWEDNGPQTVMESLAAGVPVIGSNAGGIPDFVHDGKNGLLFTVGDAKSLADAMRKLIDAPITINELRENIASPLTMSQHAAELETVISAYLTMTIERGRTIREANQAKHLKAQHLELLEKYNQIVQQQALRPILAQPSVTPILEEAKRFTGLDKHAEAIESLEQGFKQFREAAKLHFGLFELLNTTGKVEQAEWHFSLAQLCDPTLAEIHNEFGVRAFQRGDAKLAIRNFERAARFNSEFLVARKNLADSHVQQGNAQEAIKQLKTVLEMSPNDVEALASLGSISIDVKALEDAFFYFSRALRISPGDQTLMTIVEQLQSKGCGTPETLVKLSQASLLSSNGISASDAHTSSPLPTVGTFLRENETTEAALVRLTEMVQDHPNNTIVHNDLGVLCYSKGDLVGARANFQRAVDCDENHLAAKKNLADVLLQTGDGKAALRVYQGILGQSPNDVDALISVGGLLRLAKRYGSAAHHLRRALELDPTNAPARKILTLLQQDAPEIEQSGLPKPKTSKRSRSVLSRGPKLSVTRLSSSKECDEYFSVMMSTHEHRAATLLERVPSVDAFTLPGYCYICQQNVDFKVDHSYGYTFNGKQIPNWREHLVCPICSLNNRLRASIHFFEQLFTPKEEAAIYITEQCTPMYEWLKREYPNTIGSEYLGDAVPFGSPNTSGVRNESLTRLTFDANRFDFLISFEVFEHIPDFAQALRECSRVLKENGKLLFTVPFVRNAERNLVRARVNNDGSVEHILPAEYHGDPVNGEGCLAYYHFGWELFDQLRDAGFGDVAAYSVWSDTCGNLGDEQLLFVAEKSKEGTEEIRIVRTTVVEATVREVTALVPTDETLLQEGEPDEGAIVRLEKLLHHEPDHAVAHNDLGVLYFRKGDVQRAVVYFQRAVDLNEKNISAKKNLADAFIHLGEGKKAQRMYQGIVSQCPEDVEALLTLGELMRLDERYSSSAYYFRQALQLEPNNAEIKNSFDRLPGHVVEEYAPMALPSGNDVGYEQTHEIYSVMENLKASCTDEVMTVGGQQLTILGKPRHTRRDELLELYWHRHPRFTFLKNVDQNASFLDLGAGSGGLVTWRDWISPKREDIQMYAVDMIKGEFFNRYVDFQLCNLDYDTLKFGDGLFDAILSAHLFEHVRDEARLLTELRRVTKKGARMYIEVPTPESQNLPRRQMFVEAGINMSTLNFFDDSTHLRTFSLETLSNLVSQAGFKVVSSGVIDNRYIEDEMVTYGVTHNDSEVTTYAMWSKLHFAHYIISEAV